MRAGVPRTEWVALGRLYITGVLVVVATVMLAKLWIACLSSLKIQSP